MNYKELLEQKSNPGFGNAVLQFCQENRADALSDTEWEEIWNSTEAGSKAEAAVQNKRDILSSAATEDTTYGLPLQTEEGEETVVMNEQ